MRTLFLLLCVFISGCIIPPLQDIILRPNNTLEETPEDFGFNYEEITLPIAEGREISIWHVKADNPKALLVIVPGSDANKSFYAEALDLFIPNDLDVVLMDYEGFGDSPGSLSFDNLVDDTLAVFEYAVQQHENVFGFGVSIGTPSMVYAATQYDLKGVLLEGTITIWDEAELWLERYGLDFEFLYGPATVWIRPQIPPRFQIEFWGKLVDEPKFFIHSVEDNVTPIEGAREVFEKMSEPKEFWTVWGEHGTMVRIETELYEATINGWIDKQLEGSSSD